MPRRHITIWELRHGSDRPVWFETGEDARAFAKFSYDGDAALRKLHFQLPYKSQLINVLFDNGLDAVVRGGIAIT